MHNNLSVRDMMNTVELIADLLRPGVRAILFCTAQHFCVWHTPLCAHNSTQNEGSSSSSALASRDTFMVSRALLTLVSDPSHHRNNPRRKSCALSAAVKFTLHLKI